MCKRVVMSEATHEQDIQGHTWPMTRATEQAEQA